MERCEETLSAKAEAKEALAKEVTRMLLTVLNIFSYRIAGNFRRVKFLLYQTLKAYFRCML